MTLLAQWVEGCYSAPLPDARLGDNITSDIRSLALASWFDVVRMRPEEAFHLLG